MNDLIRRQDALDTTRSLTPIMGGSYISKGEMQEKLMELPSASTNNSESPNGWILCKERLPPEGILVWVSYGNEIWLLRRYALNWYQDNSELVLPVEETDAWMALDVPEPYQPKEDES